jgi:hypothetical protein
MAHAPTDGDEVVALENARAADRAANPKPHRGRQRRCERGEHRVTRKAGTAESLRDRCSACQHPDRRQATTSSHTTSRNDIGASGGRIAGGATTTGHGAVRMRVLDTLPSTASPSSCKPREPTAMSSASSAFAKPIKASAGSPRQRATRVRFRQAVLVDDCAQPPDLVVNPDDDVMVHALRQPVLLAQDDEGPAAPCGALGLSLVTPPSVGGADQETTSSIEYPLDD